MGRSHEYNPLFEVERVLLSAARGKRAYHNGEMKSSIDVVKGKRE